MEFPDRDMAMAWVGRTLVDRDGAEIGACTAVFADDATALSVWVCAEVAGSAVFIPAIGAAATDGRVRVAVRQEDVAVAPPVGGSEHITADEEAALYKHYGIPHSKDASPSLLPTEDAEPADGIASGGDRSGSASTGVASNGVAPTGTARDTTAGTGTPATTGP